MSSWQGGRDCRSQDRREAVHEQAPAGEAEENVGIKIDEEAAQERAPGEAEETAGVEIDKAGGARASSR